MHLGILRWGEGLAVAGSVLLLLRRVQQAKRVAAQLRRDRRVRSELETYARFEVQAGEDGDLRGLAQQVCGMVAASSVFRQIAMLTRGEDGQLVLCAQNGTDEALTSALDHWGEQMVPVVPRLSRGLGAEREGDSGRRSMRSGLRAPEGVKAWTAKFAVQAAQRTIWMLPLWTTSGRILGIIAVREERPVQPDDLVGLEALAAKLARSLENAALAERLLRSEKLAGLGQLAGGVAHALNNPLTAVMGFAELIAEATDEPRVQEDAATILLEAQRMRKTVQSLLDLWRPARLLDEAVSLSGLVRELAAACEGKLRARGVRLVVEMGDAVSEVRGSRDRIRLVMEHLLNNAAQAIASAAHSYPAHSDADAPCAQHIRLTVREDERGVQVIVSDTGPGFPEPQRVFDPFYTRQHAEQGAGLGLSLCYGIVREHGGEISAYNLHPRGAAVVVELPLRAAMEHDLQVSV